MGVKLRRGCLLLAVSVLTVAASVGWQRSNEPARVWVTDGDVTAMAWTPSALYVGGDFTAIGPPTGAWVGVDAGGKARRVSAPVSTSVATAVSDGSGGWFLKGDISSVGDVETQGIVHLTAAGALDRDWRLRVSGNVHVLARSGPILYVGGAFKSLNGSARANLGAVDTRSGQVLPWRPAVSVLDPKEDEAVVSALRVGPDGTIYLGGHFERVTGLRRSNVAAVQADGTLAEWAPAANGDVGVIELDAKRRRIYLAGEFTAIGKVDRAGLAAVGTRAGAPLAWDPDCDGSVNRIVVNPIGTPVYVGGEFASIGGKSRRGLAALDNSVGRATPWDPGVAGTVGALVLAQERKTIYVGGSFDEVGELERSNVAAIDTRTGVATAWDPRVIGDVTLLEPDGRGGVMIGGGVISVNAFRRSGVAALSADASAVTEWAPRISGTIRAIAADASGSRVYIGGRFTIGDVRTQQSLAVVEPASGAVAPFGPIPNSGVWSIAPTADGQTVFIGGAFSTIAGKTRRRLAAINVADTSLTAWNSGANGTVEALEVSSDVVFAAGQFNSIGGEPRKGVAALDPLTARATGWDAGANGNVSALAVTPESIYVGGEFTAIGGKSRKYVAQLDPGDGSAARWDASPDEEVTALVSAPDGSRLFAAGAFTKIAGARRDAAEFDLRTGFLTDWRPSAPFSAYALALDGTGTTVFVGGEGVIAAFR